MNITNKYTHNQMYTHTFLPAASSPADCAALCMGVQKLPGIKLGPLDPAAKKVIEVRGGAILGIINAGMIKSLRLR
jgi:hypothetical protein